MNGNSERRRLQVCTSADWYVWMETLNTDALKTAPQQIDMYEWKLWTQTHSRLHLSRLIWMNETLNADAFKIAPQQIDMNGWKHWTQTPSSLHLSRLICLNGNSEHIRIQICISADWYVWMETRNADALKFAPQQIDKNGRCETTSIWRSSVSTLNPKRSHSSWLPAITRFITVLNIST